MTLKPFKSIIQAFAVTFLAFAAVAENAYTFTFELRIPKSVNLDPATSIELTSESESTGSPLRVTKKRVEGEFQLFQYSFLLFTERRRALIVHPPDQPSQVFVLTIPRVPKDADWTKWQRPDYLSAKGDAGWDFMYDQRKKERSTNVPPDCVQLRYKIEKYKTP